MLKNVTALIARSPDNFFQITTLSIWNTLPGGVVQNFEGDTMVTHDLPLVACEELLLHMDWRGGQNATETGIHPVFLVIFCYSRLIRGFYNNSVIVCGNFVITFIVCSSK